ncbi:hypothetical protein L2E82_30645 [Cichorium intybus]|uniref:Uncharacterized protein n=1 Tax=Cichorium intybus TaxID=13427 RepID=A0ACB9D136_CICIN|nr:hypothetical protein L2E82_30645 [Cichorium intybus]
MPRCTLKIEKNHMPPQPVQKSRHPRTRVALTPFRAGRDPLGPAGPTEPDPKDAESFAHASVHTQDRKKPYASTTRAKITPSAG